MKKSLILGIGGILLFTGCCKKLALVDCANGNCNAKPAPVKLAPAPKPKPKPKKIVEPPIKKVQFNKEVCIIDKRPNAKKCILTIEAVGKGVAPCGGACSVSQAKLMARRAAIIDGYRALAEKMYGIRINGRDTVKNMVLQSSVIRGYVEGLIRGAFIVDEEYKDGIYSVVLELKLNVNKWNEFLQNYDVCATDGYCFN
jgi:hypothetical protein